MDGGRDGKSLLQFSKFRISGILLERKGEINQCVDSGWNATDAFGTSSAAEEISFTGALQRRIRGQMPSKCVHGCCIRDDLKLRAWSPPWARKFILVRNESAGCCRRDGEGGRGEVCLPSTLVRVSTGLLQADSGATLAECFFMMTSSDGLSSEPLRLHP